MRENENVKALHRKVEIQVESDGKPQTYSSRVVRIKEKKIELLSPMDGERLVEIPSGTRLALGFVNMLGAPPQSYPTVALDQTWDEGIGVWILAVAQPEAEPINMREFMRHQVTFRVIVQPLHQKEQFEALSIDLSGSGIQITMETDIADAFPNGTDLKLVFEIHGPTMNYTFEVVGRVMRSWQELINAKPTRFFGIQFVANYDENDQQAIMKYLLKELQQTLIATERFVPREFLSLLEKQSIADVKLGDQVLIREMTILFSDIRSFTTLSEKMTPEENFKFLNSYLSQMEPVIMTHHGYIDKYLGDGIMALFPKKPDNAVRGSIAMLHQLVEYNKGRRRAGYQPIQFGIGIHTGDLILGTIGGQNRMDGTVISDAVNLAYRIEEMTKFYGVSLLISEQTYSSLQDMSQYATRIIDYVKPKGKSEPLIIYEVFDGDSPGTIELKKRTTNDFEQGLILYRQKNFRQALQLFDKVWQINNQDSAAKLYMERCKHFQKYGVPEEWEGSCIGGETILFSIGRGFS